MLEAKPGVVALDSCILIHVFDAKSASQGECRLIFGDAEAGNLVFVISTMVHAEVGARSKLSAWEIAAMRRALSQAYLEPVEVSIPLAQLACDLARETGIKPLDAIHAATCVVKGVGWLLTTDERVLKAHGNE